MLKSTSLPENQKIELGNDQQQGKQSSLYLDLRSHHFLLRWAPHWLQEVPLVGIRERTKKIRNGRTLLKSWLENLYPSGPLLSTNKSNLHF